MRSRAGFEIYHLIFLFANTNAWCVYWVASIYLIEKINKFNLVPLILPLTQTC